MGIQLNAPGFELQAYRVLWTPYIRQVIERDAGGALDDPVETALSFFAATYLDALGNRNEPLICEASTIIGRQLPEIFALVVPADCIIIFGTESEIRTAAENLPCIPSA